MKNFLFIFICLFLISGCNDSKSKIVKQYPITTNNLVFSKEFRTLNHFIEIGPKKYIYITHPNSITCHENSTKQYVQVEYDSNHEIYFRNINVFLTDTTCNDFFNTLTFME